MPSCRLEQALSVEGDMVRGPQEHIAMRIGDILAFWRWGPLLDQHTGTLQKCIINPIATGSIASIAYI
jgi:hypothetical protein